MIAGVLIKSLNFAMKYGIEYNSLPGLVIQIRSYAARKGTRERKLKKKVKKEVIKLTFKEKIDRYKKV